MKLYEAITAFENVLDWMEENADEIEAAGGVLPPALEELFDKATADLENKFEATIAAERNERANAVNARAEANRLAALAKSYERRADSIKGYLSLMKRRAGLKKIETPIGKAGTYHASNPSIMLASAAIPTGFVKPPAEPEFDPRGFADALKAAGVYDAIRDQKAKAVDEGGVPVDAAVTIEAGTKIGDVVLDAPVVVRFSTYERVW